MPANPSTLLSSRKPRVEPVASQERENEDAFAGVNITSQVFAISSKPQVYGGLAEIYTGTWMRGATNLKVRRLCLSSFYVNFAMPRLQSKSSAWQDPQLNK